MHGSGSARRCNSSAQLDSNDLSEPSLLVDLHPTSTSDMAIGAAEKCHKRRSERRGGQRWNLDYGMNCCPPGRPVVTRKANSDFSPRHYPSLPPVGEAGNLYRRLEFARQSAGLD